MSALRTGVVVLLVLAGVAGGLAGILAIRSFHEWSFPWEWVGWLALLTVGHVFLVGLLRTLGVARFRPRIVVRPFSFLKGNQGYSEVTSAKLLEWQLSRPASVPVLWSGSASPRVGERVEQKFAVETGDARVSIVLVLLDQVVAWVRRITLGPVHAFESIVVVNDEFVSIESVRLSDRREFIGIASCSPQTEPMRVAVLQLAEAICEQYVGLQHTLLDNLLNQARFEQALRLLEKMDDADPIQRAWTLYRAGRFDEARELFERPFRKLRKRWKRTESAYGVASCLLTLGKYDEVLEVADPSEFPRSPEIRFVRADALRAQGLIEEAIQIYAQGIAMCAPYKVSLDSDSEEIRQLWLVMEAYKSVSECRRAIGDTADQEPLRELRDLCEKVDLLDIARSHVGLTLGVCLEDLKLMDAAADAYRLSVDYNEILLNDDPQDLQARIDSLWGNCGLVACFMAKIRVGLQGPVEPARQLEMLELLASVLGELSHEDRHARVTQFVFFGTLGEEVPEPDGESNCRDDEPRPDEEVPERADEQGDGSGDATEGPSAEEWLRSYGVNRLSELIDWVLERDSAVNNTVNDCSQLLMARERVHRAEAHFGLACLHCNRGHPDDGMSELVQSIELAPHFRERAKWDSDLDPLKESDLFRMAIDWDTNVRLLDDVEAADVVSSAEPDPPLDASEDGLPPSESEGTTEPLPPR